MLPSKAVDAWPALLSKAYARLTPVFGVHRTLVGPDSIFPTWRPARLIPRKLAGMGHPSRVSTGIAEGLNAEIAGPLLHVLQNL